MDEEFALIPTEDKLISISEEIKRNIDINLKTDITVSITLSDFYFKKLDEYYAKKNNTKPIDTADVIEIIIENVKFNFSIKK